MATPPLLALRAARVGFGGPPLFEDIDVSLGRGDRACLVGRNGSGKSTLMKALAGLVELDAGERFVQPGLRIAYLPQEPDFESNRTVAEYVGAGARADHVVEAALARLDLDGARRLGTLSGGEGRRAALARVLADAPDILLLDEPTNHLDLATIEWLERTLDGFRGGVMTVSHDRAFLANVSNRTLWLDRSRLRRSEQGFAHFERWSEEVLHAEEKAAERLDQHIARETRWLLRGITARRRRNQGRLTKLTRLREARAALLGGRSRPDITAEDGEIKSRLVIEAKSVSKSFAAEAGEKTIVRDFSTRVLRGDRIGIIGPNGAGKTTLLRLLSGELAPDRGTVRVAKHLTRAYFDQARAALDPRATVRETLCPAGGDRLWAQGRSRHVTGYLKDFLFDPDQAESPVGALSGGERNRLLLAKILATPADLLILDEPTNDLDMDTLDLLEEVIGDYTGTLLLVSHDRDFLDRTVTSTVAMEGDGRWLEFAGGYADYLLQRRQVASRRKPAAKDAAEAKPPPEAPARPKSRGRLTYKDQHELERLPDRIASLEEETAALEARLADADLYARDRGAFERASDRLAQARAELARAEDRWLELEARREALESGAVKGR